MATAGYFYAGAYTADEMRVEVHPRMLGELAPGGEIMRRLGARTGRRAEVVEAAGDVSLSHVAVLPD